MSGHSKWSTIKHQKAIHDKRRGQVFTKLAKAISLASKSGGGDSESNYKLRLEIDKAKQANMPKNNIKRAINRGIGQGDERGLVEVVYEGYGPNQVAVMVQAATDNTNRAVADIKKVFEVSGGRLGEPGSVGFQFDKKGFILVAKQAEVDDQLLKLIDLEVEEADEVEEGIEVIVSPRELFEIKKRLEQNGLTVLQAELIYAPKRKISLDDKQKEKVIGFLTKLDSLDDVLNIYTNVDL